MKKEDIGLARRALPLLLVSALVWLAPATGATISGKVTFDGTPPPPETIKVTKDTHKCGTELLLETLLVGEGKGIWNVVVSIVNAPPGKLDVPPGGVVLDQRGCRFRPPVVLLPAGAKLVMKNSDGFLHNLHTFSKINPPINKAQPGFKKIMNIRTLKKPEMIRAKCDIHSWMWAWIVVTDSPYTVLTDAAGQFQLAGVPAGTYTLKFWHERLGEKMQEVTIADDGAATVHITMGPK
ncbi:MAG: carboxypeptidase regulatory-like domain-containing protein [bacterium]|nr:carboxypeptidase regulatory-like domain-containing protein [bacterium]